MTPSEMLYEAINNLLFPFVSCRFVVRFNNLEVGTLGAAIDGCTDLNELRFFGTHSVCCHRRIAALLDYDLFAMLHSHRDKGSFLSVADKLHCCTVHQHVEGRRLLQQTPIELRMVGDNKAA
jgi:hypothetical protein